MRTATASAARREVALLRTHRSGAAATATTGCLLALLALLPPLCGAAAVEVAAVTGPFTHDGPTFVLTSPSWTLITPIVEEKNSGVTGVLIHNGNIYTFPAPKNKVGGSCTGHVLGGSSSSGAGGDEQQHP
jgi:hypothetical protein